MEYLIGIGLAFVVCIFALLTGFDRDRVFYPTMVVVVTLFYILFAVLGSSMPALWREALAAMAFVVVAVVSFKKTLWLAVAGLVGHGVFDFVHHFLIENPGLPTWWPGFCGAFDVVAGLFLAMLLVRRPEAAGARKD